MKTVIMDIVRRWWWLILGFAVFSFALPVLNEHLQIVCLLYTLFYGSMILYMVGMQNYKNLTVLPLGVEVHGKVLWVLHSGIVTLIACVVQLVFWLIQAVYPSFGSLLPQEFFAACLLYMGFAGAVQLAYVFGMRISRALGLRYIVGGWLATLLDIPIIVMTALFLFRVLSKDLDIGPLGHNPVFGTVLGAFVTICGPRKALFDTPNVIALAIALCSTVLAYRLSYQAADCLRANAMAERGGFFRSSRRSVVAFPSRAMSYALPWLHALKVVLIGSAVFLAGLCCMYLAYRLDPANTIPPWDLDTGPIIFAYIAFILFCFPALTWASSLKSFRVLPMSSIRLTLLLMSSPLLAFLATTILLALFLLARGDLTVSFGSYLSVEAVVLSAVLLTCFLAPFFGVYGIVLWTFGMAILPAAASLTPVYAPWTPLVGLPLSSVLGGLILYYITGTSRAYRNALQQQQALH